MSKHILEDWQVRSYWYADGKRIVQTADNRLYETDAKDSLTVGDDIRAFPRTELGITSDARKICRAFDAVEERESTEIGI